MNSIYIHSIETLGALDGPGIRTVIFFQGCPMRCLYCHNADTFNINQGNSKTIDELVQICKRYKPYYGTHGGVTISGGEPLMQSEGCLGLITSLKNENIHVALDTSGALFVPKALDAADLTILDIKHSNPEKFFALTAYRQDNSLKTLRYLQKNNKRFWIRHVVLQGFTDENEVINIKKLCTGAEKIELLPFHNMGADKWDLQGLDYKLHDTPPTSKEYMEKLSRLL